MKKPIFGFTLSFIAGILLGRYLTFPLLPLYFSILALFGLSFFFYLRKKERPVTYLLFSLTFFIGIIHFYIYYYPTPSNIIHFASASKTAELTGKVINRPELKEGKRKRVTFIVKAEKIEFEDELGENKQIKHTEGKVWVNSYFPYKTCNYGDIVKIEGNLRLPQGAREKGEFDWQKYLSYQGVWVEINTGKIEVIEGGKGNPILSLAYSSRNWIGELIDKTLPFPHRSVLKGILLGDKESLPIDILDSFRKTGIAHVLVVSGLHVGFVLFIIFLLFRTAGFSLKRTSLLVFPLLWYYAFLTGFRTPVVRATFMASIGLICLLVDRQTSLLVILSLAALLILIINPLNLFTVSFQLSFVTVGGIVYLTPYIMDKLKKLPFFLKGPLSVSLSAQLFILPLLAFYFHQLPLIGIAANLVIVPLIAVILALGFLSSLFGTVALGASQITANTNWLTIEALLKVVNFFSFPRSKELSLIACPRISSFPFYALLIYYAALVFLPQSKSISLGSKKWISLKPK